MAFALARTKRLKVGTSVAVLPGRHPVLVAKQLASLAALAPKRVLPVFGLRSALPAERDLFVVPDGKRAAVFDESLRLLRIALRDHDVNFTGDFFSVRGGRRAAETCCAARYLARRVGTRGVPPDRCPRRRLAGQLPDTRPRRSRRDTTSSRLPMQRAARSNLITTESTSRSATVNCPSRCSPRFAGAGPISNPRSSWPPIGPRCTAVSTSTSRPA